MSEIILHIFCDSACIARRLEPLQPAPACIPPDHAALAGLVQDWGDHRLFAQAMPPAVVGAAPQAFAQALLSFDRLDRQLRDQPFLLGDAFSVADAACFHPIWFGKHCAELEAALAARPALAAWFARIEAFGPGAVTAMTAAEALAAREEQRIAARVTADEIAIRRQDPALGEVAVHFPRAGFRIQKL